MGYLENAELGTYIATRCGSRVVAMMSLSGGDSASAYRVDLANGKRVFAKTHPDPPANFFTTEAAGLAWLAEANATPTASVVDARDDTPACLILEWIQLGGQRTSEGERVLGRQLAALHKFGASSFGRTDGRSTGSHALPNTPCDTWAEFYADRRLKPLAKIAHDRGSLSSSTIKRLNSVVNRLESFGGAEEPPARLHGDLWAGNRVIDRSGQSWLIDPAAHGGHREFDLAMMRLFGGFEDECFWAYDEAYPLSDGWQDRVRLHQLAPLIVHAIKFGGGYQIAVDDALGGLT